MLWVSGVLLGSWGLAFWGLCLWDFLGSVPESHRAQSPGTEIGLRLGRPRGHKTRLKA